MIVQKLSEHTILIKDGKMILNLDVATANDLAYQLLRAIDKKIPHPLDEQHPSLPSTSQE